MTKPIALLLISCLAGCNVPKHDHHATKPTATSSVFRPVYRAKFPDASLSCCFWDRLHALEKGDGHVAGAIPTFTEAHHTLALGITAPDPIPLDETPSVGIFSTGLNFGPGTVFAVRATFQRPNGPHIADQAWAVGLVARTGGKDDLGSETRLTTTFKVKGDSAVLNVQGITVKPTGNEISKEVYDKIVTEASHQPFTLELLVDRTTGKGIATLTSGRYALPLSFTMSKFQASSGPVITAVGATLANCCAPGKTATVEVTDFEISAPRPHGP